MKISKNFWLLCGLITAVFCLKASQNPYEEAMLNQINILDTAKTTETLLSVVQVLERISNAEPGHWHPAYYIAFTQLNLAFREKDLEKRDNLLDQADLWIKKASTISPQNSEITAMQGYIVMMKLSIDPATRGQVLAGKAMHLFEQAIEQNPENPRAICLMAQMMFGTALFFGSGTEEACQLNMKAVALYSKQEKNPNKLAPDWGEEITRSMIKNCDQVGEK